MNSRIFAKAYLEKKGFFDKEGVYEGELGKSVMEVVEIIAKQGHSGMSIGILLQLIRDVYNAYNNSDDEIWQEYWESDEGKALKAKHE